MIQDAPVAGTPLSAPFLAKLATEVANVSYFKIETAGAATKLRELLALGGPAIEGPWDGEEAITLMADLDAGCTGAMTGGGYPDGIRRSWIPGSRATARRPAPPTPAGCADQPREPPVRAHHRKDPDEGRRHHRLRRRPPSTAPPSAAAEAQLLELARELDVMALRWG